MDSSWKYVCVFLCLPKKLWTILSINLYKNIFQLLGLNAGNNEDLIISDWIKIIESREVGEIEGSYVQILSKHPNLRGIIQKVWFWDNFVFPSSGGILLSGWYYISLWRVVIYVIIWSCWKLCELIVILCGLWRLCLPLGAEDESVLEKWLFWGLRW